LQPGHDGSVGVGGRAYVAAVVRVGVSKWVWFSLGFSLLAVALNAATLLGAW
jgi:hypothetical protein